MANTEPDYLTQFDSRFGPRLAGRAPTFRAVIREAVTKRVRSIVETGCIRKEDNWDGDGQSTIIFADYVGWHSGSFSSVDLDPEACELTRKLVPAAAVAQGDSVEYLTKSKSVIDLLYLDSFDLDMANPHPAALHCMFEFCAARPRLNSGSIVFIDDSPMGPDWVVGGKGMYVAQYFKQLGIHPFTFGYQVAWIVP